MLNRAVPVHRGTQMRIELRSGAALLGFWLALSPALAQRNSGTENPGAVQPRAGMPPMPGANSFSESQARSRIESQGYAEVSPLVNDRQGIWQGTARKGNARVHVSVDYKGHVTAGKE